ncbi:hypothetical protein QTP88_006058 [Uroleucon formosanum]
MFEGRLDLWEEDKLIERGLHLVSVFIVFCGKNTTPTSNDMTCTSKVVLQLMTDYLNKGRAERKNSKGFPKDIMNSKLKKGEIKGKEDGKGVVVSIWKDKRDMRMLSTRHGIEMVDIGRISRNGENIKKPEAIVFYNKNKQGIDVSDQMNSYFTPLRKSIKWYYKVAFQLLLGTSVVNALVMYKELTGKSIQISQFRQQIIEKLIKKKRMKQLYPHLLENINWYKQMKHKVKVKKKKEDVLGVMKNL